MKLKEGEKFIVLGDHETILLKKIEMPKFKNFDKLLKKTQNFAKIKGITEKDLEKVIKGGQILKVVLDTNIFVSGIFWIGDSNKIIKLWKEGKLVLFTSREIINELEGVYK